LQLVLILGSSADPKSNPHAETLGTLE